MTTARETFDVHADLERRFRALCDLLNEIEDERDVYLDEARADLGILYHMALKHAPLSRRS